jgi:CHAD domain-containing protein
MRRLYYDVKDRSLLRHGVTLAGPEEGKPGSWFLTFPGELARLDVQAGPAESGQVPAELQERIRVHVRGRSLVPLLPVTVRRQVTTYEGPAGAVAFRLTEETLEPDGGRAGAKEWTLEAPDSGPADNADPLLREAGAEPGNAAVFLRRTLGVPEAGTVRAQEGSSVDAVLAAAFSAVSAELTTWDPRVRLDEEGAVHQLRVRSRTLRSMLKTYEKLLEKDPARDLERRLQRLGRSLSAARDAEVMRERIHESTQRHPQGTVPAHVLRRLSRKSAAEYRRAYEELIEELNSPAYFRLLALLEDFSARPPLRGGTSRTASARRLLRAAAKRQQRQVLELIAAADREQDPEVQLDLLHDVRKRSKRLRYAIRSVANTTGLDFGKKLGAAMAFSEDIQDALGAHRDSVLFQHYLAKTAREAHRSGANTFAYGVLHQAELQRQAAAEEAYHRAARRLR